MMVDDILQWLAVRVGAPILDDALTSYRNLEGSAGTGVDIAVALGALAVAVLVLHALTRLVLAPAWRWSMRRAASRWLTVPLPKGFRVRLLRHRRDVGAFLLEFPVWRYAKKDGTRDLRRSGNRRVNRKSVLEIGPWRITYPDPVGLYWLVTEARRAGHQIAPDALESSKAASTAAATSRMRAATSIEALVARFADDPSGFEHYCAETFRARGYRAEVTPPSRDGGVDIRLEHNGVRCVVECKCYHPSHVVGRPVVQKLIGANVVERAERMLVVTTSTFSRDAVEYAAQTGVELVDGDTLLAMSGSRMPPFYASGSSCALTEADTRAHYPRDMH